MKALYDLDNTVIRMVPKWVKLMMRHRSLAAKILKKLPDYEIIWDRVDYWIEDYRMDCFFNFDKVESKLMARSIDDCHDFYDEFVDLAIPDFGINDINEIVIVSQCDGESPAALSKKNLLNSWKREGKIADWVFTSHEANNKSEFIAKSKYKDFDMLAEDHPRYPIEICKLLDSMKIHMVEYPYNAHTVKYLQTVYPWRLI